MMCLWARYKKKYEEKKYFFASLKSIKKGVGSGVGAGSAPKCHGSPTLSPGIPPSPARPRIRPVSGTSQPACSAFRSTAVNRMELFC